MKLTNLLMSGFALIAVGCSAAPGSSGGVQPRGSGQEHGPQNPDDLPVAGSAIGLFGSQGKKIGIDINPKISPLSPGSMQASSDKIYSSLRLIDATQAIDLTARDSSSLFPAFKYIRDAEQNEVSSSTLPLVIDAKQERMDFDIKDKDARIDMHVTNLACKLTYIPQQIRVLYQSKDSDGNPRIDTSVQAGVKILVSCTGADETTLQFMAFGRILLSH